MILNIETEYVEFKLSTSQLSRAIESLAAMLNKNGKGKVLFGVNDDGTVVGQDVGNKTLIDISNAIKEKLVPTVIPQITPIIYDDKVVISVEVSGSNKPYSANGLYLIRIGSENKKLEPDQLKELVFSSSEEIITKMESFNQELTFNQLKQLYISKGLSIRDDTFVQNTGLLCDNGKYNVLADLLSDNNDCSIKVVRFKGIDKSEMIVRNEYGYKCLLIAFEQALNYVNSFNETRVELDGNFKRKEVKLFDEKCLREAWNNACLHTKWSKMIPPAIYIYSDRIEVVSTGGLPIDYPVEDFYKGISHPINRQLQKIMGQLDMVEQTGRGVPEIVEKYGKEAFDISNSHLIVTLKFPFKITNMVSPFDNLSLSQKKILEAISNNPEITISELTKVTGLQTSRISIIIKELKELNKINRVGSNKSGYWEVIRNE